MRVFGSRCRYPFPGRIVSLGLCVVWAACSSSTTEPPPAIEIISPADGAVLSGQVAHVEGRIRLPVTEVSVHGEIVPVTNGAFIATLGLAEGPQEIIATSGEDRASVQVIVDSLPPRVFVDTPELGAFVEGTTLQVRGRVEDATPDKLFFGQDEVQVREDGLFDFSRPVEAGAHHIRLRAEDRAGHVGYGLVTAIAGAYEEAGFQHPKALGTLIGPEGLDTIAQSLEPLLSSPKLEQLLLDSNPIADVAGGELEVKSARHGGQVVKITPREGVLDLVVSLRNIEVRVKADTDFYVPDIDGKVRLSSAEVSGSLTLDVENGLPLVEFSRLGVSLLGLKISLKGIPGFLEEQITRLLRDPFVDSVEEMVRDVVPRYLRETLAGIRTEYEFDFLGSPLVATGSFSELAVDRKGVRVAVDMGVQSLKSEFSLIENAPGSLVSGSGQLPTLASGNVRAGLSLDVINAAAYAAWSTGELSFRVDAPVVQDEPFAVSDLVLLVPSLSGLAPPEAPIAFLLRTPLPPVFSPTPDGLVEVTVPDVRTDVVAVVDSEDVFLFTVSIGARALVDVRLDGNTVTARVSEYELRVDGVTDYPEDAPQGPELDELVQSLLGDALQDLLDLGEIPLPTFPGFRIEGARTIHDQGYLTFEGELRYIP